MDRRELLKLIPFGGLVAIQQVIPTDGNNIDVSHLPLKPGNYLVLVRRYADNDPAAIAETLGKTGITGAILVVDEIDDVRLYRME
jgi:hypothetical protein